MSARIRILAAFVAVFALNAHAAQQAMEMPEHVPAEIVVKFRDAASSRGGHQSVMRTISSRLGTMSIQSIQPLETDPSLAVVKMADDGKTMSALDVLQGEPSVVYAEPNYIYHTTVTTAARGTPNDANFAKQWSMLNTGQKDSAGKTGIAGIDINILPLWQSGIVGSKDIIVAIIDTGIQWDHPDLKANLYTNPGEIADNRKDDDGNGFIDDLHGWNFNKNTANSNDDNGHGTHCAGVIGAAGNNKVGVAGINWNVSLMPVKFLSASGSGTMVDAVNAINYARMMKVNVMSNSWGGVGFSQSVYDAIKSASDAGILFVAAAGNNGASNDGNNPVYPGSYDLPNVVSVAAIDNKDKLASFSNYGATHVHVAAPGVNIYSTFKGSKYKSESGTSMAAPHVAGIAALMLSKYPHWSAEEIKSRLIKTSTPVAELSDKVAAQGRINAAEALK